MLYYYGTKISPHMTTTPEGYLICHDVPLARIGTMEYLASELNMPTGESAANQIIRVNRYADEVFAPAAMASFEGKDVTYGHPPENLTAETYAAYSRGHVENVRRQGDFLLGDLHIKDPQLHSDVENGVVREISAGYTAEFVPDGDDYKQINIRGNHVAVVPMGRAGRDVAIKDTTFNVEKGRKKMSKLTEAWLRLFSHAAKEVEGAELDRLTADAAVVLDAEPEKTDNAIAHEPQEAGVNAKLDNLLARMDRLEAALQKDESEKKSKGELSPADAIDEKIAALSGESAGVVAADSAVVFLRAMRPTVAAIEDKQVQAAVANAVLQAVQADDKPLGQIMDAVQSKAAARAQAAKQPYETICEKQQSIYDGLNPHKKH